MKYHLNISELNRSRAILVVVGIISLVLCWMTSPDRLIQLNLMNESLTSEHIPTRQIAIDTVRYLKITLLITGVLSITFATVIGRLSRLKVVRLVLSRPNLFESVNGSNRGSLVVVLASAIFGLLILVYGEKYFGYENVQVYFGSENGFFELSSAAILFINSIVAVRLAYLFRHIPCWAVSMAFLSFLFFVACGEELSWGQHALGFGTVGIFEINVQGETNLHNQFGYLADHLTVLFIVVYGILIPFIAYYLPSIRNFSSVLGVPIASLYLGIGFLATLVLHPVVLTLIYPDREFAIRPNEVREWATIIGFSMLLVEIYNVRIQLVGWLNTFRYDRIKSREKVQTGDFF